MDVYSVFSLISLLFGIEFYVSCLLLRCSNIFNIFLIIFNIPFFPPSVAQQIPKWSWVLKFLTSEMCLHIIEALGPVQWKNWRNTTEKRCDETTKQWFLVEYVCARSLQYHFFLHFICFFPPFIFVKILWYFFVTLRRKEYLLYICMQFFPDLRKWPIDVLDHFFHFTVCL